MEQTLISTDQPSDFLLIHVLSRSLPSFIIGPLSSLPLQGTLYFHMTMELLPVICQTSTQMECVVCQHVVDCYVYIPMCVKLGASLLDEKHNKLRDKLRFPDLLILLFHPFEDGRLSTVLI